MHALAVVVLPRLQRAVHVDADADVELELLVDRALNRDRGADGVRRLLERGKEPVARVVDDLPLEVGEDRAERVVVAAEQVDPVAVGGDGARQLGRADDVREEEGLQDVGRDVAHEELGDAVGVAGGAEALEARRGRLELPDRGVLVASGAQALPSCSRARATSYVAPFESQIIRAWRNSWKAASASPRPSATCPRANAADARSADVS